MTFAQILADVYRRTNLPATPSTADATRIKAFANETHREVLTAPGLDRLRDDTLTFASVSGTKVYAIGQAVARVKDIFDQSTNQWRLRQLDLDDLRTFDPGLTATGSSDRWVPLGYRQVAQHPATTGVWAASSSASDTTPVVHVEGVRTGGYRTVDQSATLTGTSRVQLGAFTDYVEIDKFYASAVGVGTISLYDAAVAGNELARISIGFTSARYLTIQLYPTPAAAITYTVDYTREMLDLVQDSDEPFLPVDFHDLIGLGARTKEYEFRADARLSVTQQQYVKRRSDLFQWVANPPDYRPVPGRGLIGRSNLGGFYPAGIW